MIKALDKYSLRPVDSKVDPEIHKTKEAQDLKGACQQFESILWAKLWKQMRNTAQAISGNDKGRPWQQMEDLSLEMASDDLVSSSGGAGLWKMLYDSMIGKIAADREAQQRKEADAAADAAFEAFSAESQEAGRESAAGSGEKVSFEASA
ncbi:MAG: hypothetical protein K5841_03590 [Fretibacterium sp.]|nr:hypothetical protein [Fretibacterium sp.]